MTRMIRIGVISLDRVAVILMIIVNSIARPSSTFDSGDNWELQIKNLKYDRLPCQKLRQNLLGPLNIPRDRVELDTRLRVCENYYTRVIGEILEDLGLIGGAIKIWLSVLNELALIEPRQFQGLNGQDIRTVPALHSMLKPVRNRVHQDPDENYYLEAAYLYGLGICTHLNSGPLFRFTSDLLSFWRTAQNLDRRYGVRRHEFVFLHELENYRDENGQLHKLVLMKTLANVCISLATYPLANDVNEIYHVRGISGIQDFMFHFGLIRDDSIDELTVPDIYDHLGPPSPGRLCNQADYYRFQRGLAFIDSFDDADHSSTRTGTQYFVEQCYSRIAIKLAEDQIQLIPDDLETYVFTSMLRHKLNDNDYLDNRMNRQLRMRFFMYSSKAELLFFKIPQNTNLVDRSRSLAAYLDGKSGPCEFYARFRNVYQHRTSLFEMLEFFTFLATLNLFWHPISNDATGFFFMWTICRESRLIDMSQVSS